MKKMNQIYVYILSATVFLSACAPDRNVLSDEERLNVMCSTKKKDRDERCLSDEISMDYRDMSVILVQKMNREVTLQSKILAQNQQAISTTASNPRTQIVDQAVQGKRALTWDLDYVGQQDELTGLQRPTTFTGKTMTKDLGATADNVQSFDLVTVFGGLTGAAAELLNFNLSRNDAKEKARVHGVFALVQEQMSYSLAAPIESAKLSVEWTGQALTAFSKFDKSGKHFFSRDQVSDAGRLELAVNDAQETVVQKFNFEWNLTPRKDAVLNYKVDLIETAKVVEVEGGCRRLVGEFLLTNTNDGVKKKPLKTFISKLVLTETELNIFGTNRDGGFSAKPAKTVPVPSCSEYNGLMVDFGRVL